MNSPELPRPAEITADVLETPVTRDVMPATLPDGLDQDIIDDFHDAAVQGKPFVVRRTGILPVMADGLPACRRMGGQEDRHPG